MQIVEPSTAERSNWPGATVQFVIALENRIAELEAALRDAIPFLAVNMDKYRRDYGLTELHPTHADIIDRISRLSGGGPLSKKLTG